MKKPNNKQNNNKNRGEKNRKEKNSYKNKQKQQRQTHSVIKFVNPTSASASTNVKFVFETLLEVRRVQVEKYDFKDMITNLSNQQ